MKNDIKKLRNKYKKYGYNSLTNMEKTEFLLSYSEKNAENIRKSAEKIMQVNSTIKGEMKTDVFFAMNEFDISFESAVLLRLILKTARICSLNRLKLFSDSFKKIKLDSVSVSKRFFHAFFQNSYTEEFLVVALNDNLEIINHKKILSCESDMVEISDKKIYHFAKANKSRHIFFAHCHPSGNSKPSFQDIDTTLKIRHTLDLMNINLIDHIIIGKNDATSLNEVLKDNNFSNCSEYPKNITKV